MSSRGIRRPDNGPIIGILAGRSPIERYSLHEGYVHAVAAIGAFPLILPVGPDTEIDRLMTQVLACDALIVSGGDDVDPELSHIANPADAVEPDRARDVARDRRDPRRDRLRPGRARHLPGAFRSSPSPLAARSSATSSAPASPTTTRWSASTSRSHAIYRRLRLADVVLADITEVNSAHHQAVAGPR